jgi:RimJ/RimL family protein N-acetyltransferase
MESGWPLFNLTVRTPVLTLRYATDEDLQVLAGFRRVGRVVAAGEEPFDGDSTFYAEPPQSYWRAVMGEWGARSRTGPEWWHLSMAVLADGEVIGQQNLTADHFRRRRTVNTFSFLDRAQRGRGLGKEMRTAALHLAFAGLDAERAESDAFADNEASLGVSRALGYEPDGTMMADRPRGASLI